MTLIGLPAQAQDAANDAARPEREAAVSLEPIEVTGRKRTERDADIPVSTTILQADSLPPASLDPGAEILRATPNAGFVDLARPSDRYGTMRGIGPLGTPLNSLDSTVGYSIDGVPTSAFGFSQPMLDVERVEVLRGPQGTLFGRNALGGSVNVVNRAADGEREFRLNSEFGSDGHRVGEAIAGGWLSPDRVAGRAAIRFQGFNGDIPNVVRGGHDGDASIGTGRASLRFTPDDSWTIDVTGGYSRDHRSNPVWLLKETSGFPKSGSDIKPQGDRDIAQGTVNVRKDFERFSATSVTNFQDLKLEAYDDYADSLVYAAWLGGDPSDYADKNLEKGRVRDREKLFNQEFRLNSADGEPLAWVFGVNYFRSNYDTLRRLQSSIWPTVNGRTHNQIVSQTWAAFGDVTVPLGNRLSFSFGLRLAHDRQTLDGAFDSGGAAGLVPFFNQRGKVSDSYLTGRTALSYKLTPDWMAYASVARGYSSGGFERTTQNAPYGAKAEPFRPSTGWTYEIGSKATVFDRLQLSASVFFNDVKDGQLSAFDMVTYQVFFANQDYRSYGFELSGVLQASEELSLHGGVGHTRSKLVNVSSLAGPGVENGNKVPQSPDWTANLGFDYRAGLERIGLPGAAFVRGDYQYVGARESDVQNNIKLNPYGIVNARVGWQREGLTVYAFANNLFDKRPLYYAAAYSPSVTAVIAGRGRVIGLGASHKW